MLITIRMGPVREALIAGPRSEGSTPTMFSVTQWGIVDAICFALFFAYLAWLPLPFGSASDGAQIWLIVPALVLGATTILHVVVPARRYSRAVRVWLAGAALFLLVAAIQLVPLPVSLLGMLSPKAAAIRRSADGIARLAGVMPSAFHPLTLDPTDTGLQVLRLLAFFSIFVTALLLVRGAARRMALAFLLVATAMFETFYAVREASLGRFSIWGWKNTLMYGRPSGTFVNPNHFAHYAAIILPMAGFLCALAWHESSRPGASFGRHAASLIEKRLPLFAMGALGALACVTSIVIAQSRGAVLAVLGGIALASVMTRSGAQGLARRLWAVVSVAGLIVLLVFVLGRGEIASRLHGDQTSGLGGRRAPLRAAVNSWSLFPVFGSGANTFEDVILMTQKPGEILFNHAHNDYVEIAATMGLIGLLAGFAPLLWGYHLLSQELRRGTHGSWRRDAFQVAALTSVGIALVHALFDFNFFIPANPATLAAIAGAAAGATARQVRQKDRAGHDRGAAGNSVRAET